MNNNKQAISSESKSTRAKKTIIAFSLSTFMIGMMASGFSFLIFPSHPTYESPGFLPPSWFFAMVWCILYPCIGIAGGYLWLLRNQYDLRASMAFYISMLVTNLLFLPISNLSGNNPGIMTLMDLNGVVYSILFSWICNKYSREAFLWSLPLLIWMPVTASIKILLWMVVSI